MQEAIRKSGMKLFSNFFEKVDNYLFNLAKDFVHECESVSNCNNNNLESSNSKVSSATFIGRTCVSYYRHSQQLKFLLTEEDEFMNSEIVKLSPFSRILNPFSPIVSYSSVAPSSLYGSLQHQIWRLELTSELTWVTSVVPKLVSFFHTGLHELGEFI